MIMATTKTRGASESAPARDSAGAKALYEQAMKAAASGSLNQALLDKLEKAHALDPHQDEITFKLAWYLDLVGEDEAAVELYESLAGRRPVREGVLLNLSVLYQDLGRYDDAEECLYRLLSAKPRHVQGRMYYRHVEGSLDMEVEDETEKRTLPRNLLLETPVTDFELSVRARKGLQSMNLQTLGDLLRTTEAQMRNHKNIGETTVEEIKQILAKKGLRIGQAAEASLQAQRRELLKMVAANVSESVLNKPIGELGLPGRCINPLSQLNISTVADLAVRTEAELGEIKNFGDATLEEIKKKLLGLGITLRKV